RAPLPIPSFPTRRSSDLHPAASARAGPAAALSDVALSGAEPHRVAGMDLHLCHDAAHGDRLWTGRAAARCGVLRGVVVEETNVRSEEHTSELQSRGHLVC